MALYTSSLNVATWANDFVSRSADFAKIREIIIFTKYALNCLIQNSVIISVQFATTMSCYSSGISRTTDCRDPSKGNNREITRICVTCYL